MPARKKNHEKVLLKTGAVLPSLIRCGKPNCRCAHGGLHGPYWYRFYRDHLGRQHRQYIPKDQVADVLREQAQERAFRQHLRDRARSNQMECQRLEAELRELLAPYVDLMNRRGHVTETD